MSLEGIKIVKASEMARIEKESIEEGASGEAYMLEAGEGIADRVEQFVLEEGLEKRAVLLVGKGNNGGDAFVAGTFLLNRGFHVEAFMIAPMGECRPLCQKHGKEFQGKIQEHFNPEGVLVDGLLGTGFQGEVEGKLKDVILQANGSGMPILSVDIPSGINGDSGVGECAINATKTITLGMAKLGLLIGKGYDHLGKFSLVDFGMEKAYQARANGEGLLLNEDVLPSLLPSLQRSRHKYQAGYVIALAGSPGMPGAAMLSCLAALRSGAGIVRLFHPKGMEEELASSPYELIRTPFEWGDPSEIFEEGKRARACLVGPGVGKGEGMHTFLQLAISKLNLPTVVDADALYHLKVFPKEAILTPHHKEMERLLGREGLDFAACQTFAEQNGVTIILKGAPTWIFHPQALPLVIARGDPGMATAGTGDVLTGIVAALLAQGLRGREAAALAVYLHAFAGEAAAKKQTSYGIIASDVIEALPEAFQSLLLDSR